MSSSGAAAISCTRGQFFRNFLKYGPTVATVVCCSMISLSQTWYGSGVTPGGLRHGSVRAWRSYQARIRSEKGFRSGNVFIILTASYDQLRSIGSMRVSPAEDHDETGTHAGTESHRRAGRESLPRRPGKARLRRGGHPQ